MANGYFRLEVKHITRDTRNIVASASYRADEKLYSERTDEYIRFKNHTVKPESMILTPENAPEWASDRNKLWNEVDKQESKNNKTNNPRLATEVLLSLPNDVDREVQTEIAKNFVQDEFVSKGMVADICIHRDDSNNPHAHVLITQRPFNKNGTWGNKTKTRTQYDENGKPKLNKNGNKIRKQERFADIDVKQLRNKWEHKLNFYAERENSNRTYDSRSFEEQGRNELPLLRLSREEYRIENKEKKRCEKLGIKYQPITYYGKINQEIREYNHGIIKDLNINETQKENVRAFNNLVEKHKTNTNNESYQLLAKRYKHDVSYIEAKETINNMHKNASTFGRKIENERIKLDYKEQYLDFIVTEARNNKDVSKYGFTIENFNNEMQKQYDDLYSDKLKNEKMEMQRLKIYQSAKDVFEHEIESNNKIVANIYPNHHDKFNNDEKAFIINEAFKGRFIHVAKVEKTFKEENDLPANLDVKDQYIKVSKDIFFSKNLISNSNSDSIKDIANKNIEKAFIDTKLKELKQFEPFINEDLQMKLGNHNFNKVENESLYSKSQLIISLEKYNNIPKDEVIKKHIEQNIKHENEYNESQNQNRTKYFGVLNILDQYVNHLEHESSSKKKNRKNRIKKNNERY